MKFKINFKKVLIVSMFSVFTFLSFVLTSGNGISVLANTEIDIEEAKGDYVDNLRFGYNVTGGNAICDDGLNISNPILKPFKEGLYKYVSKKESNTKTEAGNFVSDSAVGIATESGIIYSGGIEAKVAAVNMNVESTFNKNSSFKEVYSERYETYYQQINRVSYVIQGNVDLRDYLEEDFKDDMYAINDVSDAKDFLEKYGTHLFTGFQYGGLFQVSNYIKTKDSSSDINQVTDLSTKMQTAFGNYGGGASFSFSEQYTIHEQQSYGTSNYKAVMYGGESVTQVSLDHLFTYNSSFADGKGNYVYDRWVTSINNAVRLAIIGTPQSARNIPVWDLLPSSGYTRIKSYLIEAYANLCGDKYAYFLEKYPAEKRKIGIEEDVIGTSEVYGYSISHKGNTSYYEDNNNSGVYKIAAGSELFINFVDNIPYNEKSWKVSSGKQYAEVLDEKAGLFKVSDTATKDSKFTIALYSGEEMLYNRIFTVVDSKFSGGEGTEENPYLISTADDFTTLCRETGYWGKHFRLTNNIDFSNAEVAGIGNKTNPFTGTFDGNYYTISNAKVLNPRDESLGLFAYNQGTIKNLFVNNLTVGKGETDTSVAINYAGGIVGYNQGTLKNCRVTNLTLEVRYAIKQNFNIYVGGLVGCSVANGTVASTIEECSVENIIKCKAYINGDNSIFVSRHDCYAVAGGLVGYADKTTILNCYTRTLNDVYSYAKATRAYVYTGGIVGQAVNGTTITNSLVNKIVKVSGGAEGQGAYSTYKYSAMVGDYSDSTFVDCYAEKYYYKDVYIGMGVSNGCKELENVTYDSASTISSEIWCKSSDEQASLIKQTFNSNSALVVSTDNAKTEYFYGEPFNISGVVLEGRFATGNNSITINEIKYDASDFDPYTIGTYVIRVYALGYSASYEVVVKKAEVIGLEVEANTDKFYVDENIDADDFKVYYVLENGQLLDVEDQKLDYVNYPKDLCEINESLTYVLGDNQITVTCGKLTGYTIVQAEDKQVISIKVSKQPAKLVYKAGETFSTVGLEVTAKYSDNSTIIINNSDLEIIGEVISEGTNTIILAYGNYITCELEVEGTESSSNKPGTGGNNTGNQGGSSDNNQQGTGGNNTGSDDIKTPEDDKDSDISNDKDDDYYQDSQSDGCFGSLIPSLIGTMILLGLCIIIRKKYKKLS